MTQTNDIERLEARIAELEGQQQALEDQLLQARVDQMQGRIDDLELQAHLGELELRDRIDPIVDRLRNQWLAAKAQLTVSNSGAAEALDALRVGIEWAVDDLRAAVNDARKAVR